MNREKLKQLFPNASPDFLDANSDGGKDPIPQRPVCNEPVPTTQPKAKDSGRFTIHVKSYRTRLLDEDNLVAKFHVDALRYAGILPTDAPEKTSIQVSQEKVKREGQKTEITISWTP